MLFSLLFYPSNLSCTGHPGNTKEDWGGEWTPASLWESFLHERGNVLIVPIMLTIHFLPHRGAEGEADRIRGQGEWPEAGLHQSRAPQQAGGPHPLPGQWLEGGHCPCSGTLRCPCGVQCGLVSAHQERRVVQEL